MKKLLAAIFVSVCGFFPLFADDVADVKAVIYRNHELQERHDFKALPALYSRDYMQINARSKCLDYVMVKLHCIFMDGKHPEEFLQFMTMLQNGGRLPDQEAMFKIGQWATAPEFIRAYRSASARALAYGDKELAAWRKSVKFVRFEIKDDLATVVEEYDGYDPESGAPKHKTVTLVLRRENGDWRYFRVIDNR